MQSSTGSVTAASRNLKKLLGNPKIIFVLGGPASGKGTQCEKIVEEFGFTHISTGDLFRAEVQKGTKEGEKLKAIMAAGKLVPFELTVQVLINGLISTPSKTNTYLIDGFPRAVEQAKYFEQQVTEVAQILFYDVAREVMEARCLKRAETSGRVDDNEKTILKRVQTYFDETMPVVNYYKNFGKVAHINAMGSITDVYGATKRALLPQCMCLLGPKVSGKSTIGRAMAERTNMKLVDFNDFIRSNGLVGQDDEVITAQFIQSLARDSATRLVLENFPQNLTQAKYFVRNGVAPSHVFTLQCCKDTCQERMLTIGQSSPNYVSSPLLTKKIHKYHQDMKELLPFFKETGTLCSVSTDQAFDKSIASVYEAIEPLVIHIRPGAGADGLRGTIVENLASENGFVPLDVDVCIKGETERATAIGKEFVKLAHTSKVPPASLIVKMLNRIIYCGQPDLNKFILVNFPDIIEQADAFEAGCAKISAMVYPTVAGGATVEIRENAYASFNIDTLFQKRFKLKPMGEWNAAKFEEQMGNKVSFGVIIGETMTGKSTVGKYMKDKMDYQYISMPEVSAKLAAERTVEGEDPPTITQEEVDAEIVKRVNANKKARFVFDDWAHKDDEDFFKLIGQFGTPEFILNLQAESANIKARYLAKAEKEEMGEEDTETLKADRENYKAKKQAITTKFGESVNFVTQVADGSTETVTREVDSKFSPKLILVNHEKLLPVDTVCANMALKYNMLYISVYQLIREHVQKDTEWGQKLTASRRDRPLIASMATGRDEFQEVQYSPVHYSMRHVLALIKDTINQKRTTQSFVLLEGMCNSNKLSVQDDQMEIRVMDEFFALEEHVAAVSAVFSLTYEFETELLPEPVVDPKADEERKAALVAKERAKRAAQAEIGEDGGAPEEGEEAKAPAFEPLMYNWTSSNRAPKNLAQLYNGKKGVNFMPEAKPWTNWVPETEKDPTVAIAEALNDFCGKLLDQDNADKCLHMQVQFP